MYRKRSTLHILLTIALAISPALAVAGDSANDPVKVRHENDIAYVSGGIGDREQAAVNAAGKDFSLKVTFAIPEGNYLSGGQVKIEDDAGNTMLDVETQGPVFYADLAPGTYTVSAEPLEYAEQREERTVRITDGQAIVHFTWNV